MTMKQKEGEMVDAELVLSNATARIAETFVGTRLERRLVVEGVCDGFRKIATLAYPPRSHGAAAVIVDEINRTGQATLHAKGLPACAAARMMRYSSATEVTCGDLVFGQRETSENLLRELQAFIGRAAMGCTLQDVAIHSVAARRANAR